MALQYSTMPTDPRRHNPADPRDRALRQAPASGDVVDKGGCCSPGGRAGASARGGRVVNAGCCGGKDLGPLDVDREGPSDDDIERFSDVTRACPNCKREVFDEAAICYHCGEAFSSGPKPISKWTIGVIVVLIASMAAMYIRYF